MAWCHCTDCRRWTGAPAPAFAGFAEDSLHFDPPLDAGRSFTPGVRRWSCPDCGTPLAARFDYLPGQIYVPLGVIDQADMLAPELHCHTDSALPWVHIDDDLPREAGSAHVRLAGG